MQINFFREAWSNTFWEFDPGSGWTLATCLRHASRGVRSNTDTGKRVRNTLVTYPKVMNKPAKAGLIHDGSEGTKVILA